MRFYLFYCISVCLNVYLCTICVPGFCGGGQERALDPLGLELKMVMSCHVGVRI